VGGGKVIDVTSLLTSPREDFENLFDRTPDIIQLIRERLKDIYEMEKLREKENLSERELFNKYSSPDAIVIDGRRGTGKTTHLLTLKVKVERDSSLSREVKVLDVIDPTNISDKIDILQVFLANLQEELEAERRKNSVFFDSYKREYQSHTRDFHHLKRRIRKLSQELIKLNSEKFLETEQEAAQTYKVGNDISFEIHKLAKDFCRLLGKRTLILPIDDIDMNLKQSMKVLNFVKDNFSTPYIIPVVALDLSQALAIVKKEKYNFFGVQLWEKPSDKTFDLRFLDKLPSEWIQKVFSPSKRVVLPDVYNIYLNYLYRKEPKVYFTYGVDRKIKLEFSEAVNLMLSLVYEWNNVKVKDPRSYFVKNYLEGRSVRDFLNDLRALMRGISKKLDSAKVEGDEYVIECDLSELADRFKPYSLYKEETSQDTISWFWKRFIEVFKRRIKESDIRNLRDTVREVLKVADEENEIVSRLEKSYYRILMQKIYTDSIRLYLKRESDNYFTVSKYEKYGETFLKIEREVSLNRMLNLAFRTIIPAYLFLWAVKKKYISHTNFDFSEFSELYSSLKLEILNEAIEEVYRNILIWHLKYPSSNNETSNNKIPFCSIPFVQEKYFLRHKTIRLVRALLNVSDKFLNEDTVLTKAYSPETPTVPYVYFSPFKFWFNLFMKSEQELKVVIKPPWSFGVELLRNIVSRYTENLTDGLYNFNKKINANVLGIPSEETIHSPEEVFNKINNELKKVENILENEGSNILDTGSIKLDIENLIEVLEEYRDYLPKGIIGKFKGKYSRKKESEINYSQFKKDLEDIKERVISLVFGLILKERAILRAILSATYLPIHHVVVRLLQYAGLEPCEDMYTGYIRYGFRPDYEEDIHKLDWDVEKELKCLEEKLGDSTGISKIIGFISKCKPGNLAIEFAFDPSFQNEDEKDKSLENLTEEDLKERLIEKYIELYEERDENLSSKLGEFIKIYKYFVEKSDKLESK